MNRIVMDLQHFTEMTGGAEAAAPAETAGAGTGSEIAAETGTFTGPAQVGDTLADGQKVQSARVAAELNRQMKRHPELRAVYGQTGAQKAQAAQPAQPAEMQPAAEGQGQTPQEKTIQQRWEEAKKGEFKELFAADQERAIKDRFKNQADAQKQLNAMQPMLNALMQKAGVQSVEELSKAVLDDDSLYEDEAEERGMTVSALKAMKQLEKENQEMRAREEADLRDRQLRQHFEGLARQGEELKKIFPQFDLMTEMQNPTFRNMTAPGVGVSVKDAYYAIHHEELGPQMMAYGMNRAKQQMGQTLQAQRRRPAEGAMRGAGPAAAEMNVDFSKLSRKERDEYRRQVHAGKKGGTFA